LIKIFARGFWTNALNPKVALFFLAFLPQFIDPGAVHKTLAFVLLGLVFNLNSLWVNLGFAWLGASLGAALGTAGSPRWRTLQGKLHWLERAAGVMFIAFGLKLALSDNPVA
jgi:threonine/homoserine/homoserine lactone efflux protein